MVTSPEKETWTKNLFQEFWTFLSGFVSVQRLVPVAKDKGTTS